MNDTISRQAAIDALRKMQTYKMFSGDDMLLIDQAGAQTELMLLPPAELGTNLAEVGTDCISRQQMIDALRDYLVGKRCPDDGTLTCRLIENEVINKLPTIHHEHGTNLAQVGTDCISRQAAIETFKDCAVNGVGIDGIVDALEQLPPIQPEIVRCKDCKYAEYINDVQTLWCTECGQGRTVAPNDFCSYAERREVTT